MPSPRSRRHRAALAAVAALLAVLTGALLCAGPSAAAATAGAPEDGRPRVAVAARPGTAVPAAVTSRVAVPVPAAVASPGGYPAGEQPSPGCGEGSGDGGIGPAVPPRGSAAHELLPALPAAAQGAAGCPAADGAALDLAPGRAPPALAAPGPIDLSVLRV